MWQRVLLTSTKEGTTSVLPAISTDNCYSIIISEQEVIKR